MRAVRYSVLFLGAAAALGTLLTPKEESRAAVDRGRTWQESRDLHIAKHAERVMRESANRLLAGLLSEHPDLLQDESADAVIDRSIEDWTRLYSEAYAAFHPGTVLLSEVLQGELGHLSAEEFEPIAAELTSQAERGERWPTSVLVGGERRVILVDLRDYADLFESRGYGIRPEGALEARIRGDLLHDPSSPSEGSLCGGEPR